MPAKTNIANLDALIAREDLAAPGETGEDITSLSVAGLEPRGFLYPALRKPDFQRETANWTPEQVADLIATFARRDLIPAVILWRGGQNVFVIDGAHRLSALIAWVHNDYGDGDVSRRFFQNYIPEEQAKAAQRTRDLVNATVGSYQDHKIAIDFPDNSRPDIVERAARIGWQEIPAQWIRNADHDKAEKSFFRINQGGTKIDPTEKRILVARKSAAALAARAIVRGGTGNNYWRDFSTETQEKIENVGREIRSILFDPAVSLPIKTLDLPVAGQGYGPHVLPIAFDFVSLTNRLSSRAEEDLPEDTDGSLTLSYLTEARRVAWRICSTHPSSLGLHPALYFYTRSGVFQSTALLSFIMLVRDWDTPEYLAFTDVREKFESFLLGNRGITEAVRRLGSGARSRPRITALYGAIIEGFQGGKSLRDVARMLSENPLFEFLVAAAKATDSLDTETDFFSREMKGAAFLKDALPAAPKCPTCRGMLHRNGMHVGHKRARREGGTGQLSNARMQHPFCNSTVEN
jgi:hypothetical protein